MKNKIIISTIILPFILPFLSGCYSSLRKVEIVPEVNAVYSSQALKLDGKLSDSAWKHAEWTYLDSSRPEKPMTQKQWAKFYPIAGTKKYIIDQFAQKVKAAVIWSDSGLYFGIKVDDIDIQGKMTKDNDWIWLEDVVEVFLSRNMQEFCELQVNPSNAIFWTAPESQMLHPKTAVYVSGSINKSKELDNFWSTEIFLPWSYLEKSGLAAKPGKTNKPERCSYVRFAAWDLSIYTQIRINRYTSPGKANPHQPQYYRPLMCLPK